MELFGWKREEGQGKGETHSDEQLMALAQKGKGEPFCRLIERYREPLASFIGPYCRWDMAQLEELLQGIFVRVYEKRRSYTRGRPFRSWLYSVARNYALDNLRKKKREGRVSLHDNYPMNGRGPEEGVLREEGVAELVKALELLPAKQREVVNMVRQGLEYREISKIMKISEVSVRNNLSHAIKRLRKEMG